MLIIKNYDQQMINYMIASGIKKRSNNNQVDVISDPNYIIKINRITI